MKILFLCFGISLLAFPSFAQDKLPEPIRVIDAWLDAQRDYEHLPGISAGIVRNKELIWSSGFGYSDIEHKTRATDSTVYSICSISKLFTSIAILQLRDQQKLNLDDPIGKYLPWFDIGNQFTEGGPVTIRALLTHSSGLPRESDFPYWTDRGFPFPSRQDFRKKLSQQKMLYPPSSVFQYSNLGMSLLGEVVSTISGKTYDEYIRQHILEPLNLRDTKTQLPRDLRHGKLATGYTVVSRTGTREALDLFSANSITPAAGFSSNVKDLAKFASWQFDAMQNPGDPVLNGNTLREMQRVHWMDDSWNNARGLGFEIKKMGGVTVVGHSGGCPGYLTQIRMIPEKELAIIVMVNGLGVDTYRYVQGIYSVLTAYEKQKASNADVDLDQYAGVYYSYWSGEIMIVPWKGRLAAFNLKNQNIGEPASVMEHVEGDTFRYVRNDGYEGDLIRFERGKGKQVVKYWRHSGYTEKIK